MEIKKQIKNIFSNILGVDVDLEFNKYPPYEISTDKDLFLTALKGWDEAWKIQNDLFIKYGLDFGGYDVLLYTALENLILLKFGNVKFNIIVSYIYTEKDGNGDKILKITDKNDQNYLIKSIEDLYELIMEMNDDDFLKDKE